MLVSIRKLRMRNSRFPVRKAGIFSSGKEIEYLRGGVQRYAAQENPKIDAARGKKHPFRTETMLTNAIFVSFPGGKYLDKYAFAQKRSL